MKNLFVFALLFVGVVQADTLPAKRPMPDHIEILDRYELVPSLSGLVNSSTDVLVILDKNTQTVCRVLLTGSLPDARGISCEPARYKKNGKCTACEDNGSPYGDSKPE